MLSDKSKTSDFCRADSFADNDKTGQQIACQSLAQIAGLGKRPELARINDVRFVMGIEHMKARIFIVGSQLAGTLSVFLLTIGISGQARGQVVPGTGTKVSQVGDDFEDVTWKWIPNFPKASEEIDKQARLPNGHAVNNRLYEPLKRGEPDVVKRVFTPPGGLPHSFGSLLIRTVESGVPGQVSNKMQQDDLCMNVAGNMGGPISVSRTPNFVVRVFVPPLNEWEPRTGPSFGVRGSCFAKKSTGFMQTKLEEYWPGFFFCLYRKADGKGKEDFAALSIRSDKMGQDVFGPMITPGWWTVGMSFTPDGQIHYYAHAGLEDLKPKDCFYSQFPYNLKCETFETFFFNICNMDDGHTSSTAWIIDDPTLYLVK